jgi:hypothetical protein
MPKPKSPRAPVPPEPEPRLVIPDAVVIEGEIWRVYRERDAPRRLRGKRALLAEGDAGRSCTSFCTRCSRKPATSTSGPRSKNTSSSCSTARLCASYAA